MRWFPFRTCISVAQSNEDSLSWRTCSIKALRQKRYLPRVGGFLKTISHGRDSRWAANLGQCIQHCGASRSIAEGLLPAAAKIKISVPRQELVNGRDRIGALLNHLFQILS